MKRKRRFVSKAVCQTLESRIFLHAYVDANGVLQCYQVVTDAQDHFQLFLDPTGTALVARHQDVTTHPGADDDPTPLSSFNSINIVTQGGNDTIEIDSTGGKPVTVDAGSGDDYVRVSTAVTTDTVVFGGLGNDSITGGGNADEALYGNEDNDTINGGPFTDFIYGGLGNDVLYGNDGDDIIDGDFGDDYIQGGKGNDNISDTNGINYIYGNDGNDLIVGINFLSGDAGDDVLYAGQGNPDSVYGGTGADVAEVDAYDTIASVEERTLYQSPYLGSPAPVGNIEVENFDFGGQGIAYFDTDGDNSFGHFDRRTAVDVSANGSGPGIYAGDTHTGEWLKYTVTVPSTGSYDLVLRAGDPSGVGGMFHFDIDGNPLTGEFIAPSAVGTSLPTFTAASGISLTAGTYVFTLAFDSEGAGSITGNFDWFKFTHHPSVGSVSASPNPVNAGSSTTVTASNVADADNNVDHVSVYRESNGTPGLQTGNGGDTYINADYSSSGGWSIAYSTSGLASGIYTLYARAQDATGLFSNVVSTQLTVGSSAIIVDNQQASLVGTWTSSTSTGGFYGSDYLHDGNTGKGSKSATFTPNLPTTGSYQVFARWTAGANRANNVPFDIFHQGTTTTVPENQQNNGGAWVLLGTYTFGAGTGGNVKIRNAGTSGYVIADAVEFVPAAAATTVTVDDPSATYSGTWKSSSGISGYYGSGYQYNDGFSGAATATFTPNLTAAATYLVYAQWAAYPNRADNALITINSSAGAGNVRVDQSRDGGTMVLLGAYSFAAGTAGNAIVKNSGADGNVIADAIRWTPSAGGTLPGAASNFKAVGASSTQINLTWTENSSIETGYQVERSTAGGAYSVVAQLAANANSFNDTGLLGGTSYTYRVRPFNASGLGAYSATATAQTTGSLQIVADNQNPLVTTITGTWDLSRSTPGYIGGDYLADQNSGKGTKTVKFTPNLPVAGTYQVYARWTAGSNRATNVPFDILHQGTTTTVTENQQINGGAWVLLGSYSFNAGTASSVTIRTTGTNGYVIADAVQFVIV